MDFKLNVYIIWFTLLQKIKHMGCDLSYDSLFLSCRQKCSLGNCMLPQAHNNNQARRGTNDLPPMDESCTTHVLQVTLVLMILFKEMLTGAPDDID